MAINPLFATPGKTDLSGKPQGVTTTNTGQYTVPTDVYGKPVMGSLSPSTSGGNQNPTSNNVMDTQVTPNVSNPIQSTVNKTPGTKTAGWGSNTTTKTMTPASGAASNPNAAIMGTPAEKTVQTGATPISETPELTMQQKWEQDPMYAMQQKNIQNIQSQGQLASDSARQFAMQQAALMGIEVGSPAYTSLLKDAESMAARQSVQAEREAGAAGQGYFADFVAGQEAEDEAVLANQLDALAMLDLNPDAQAKIALAMASPNPEESIQAVMSDIVGEGGINEAYAAKSETAQAVEAQAQINEERGMTPVQALAAAEDTVYGAYDTATEQASKATLERETLSEVSGGNLPTAENTTDKAELTEKWNIINSDIDAKNAIAGDNAVGAWWSKEDALRDSIGNFTVNPSDVYTQLDKDGVTDGSYIQNDGKIYQVQRRDAHEFDNGKKMRVTVYLTDPSSGAETSIETVIDRRGV